MKGIKGRLDGLEGDEGKDGWGAEGLKGFSCPTALLHSAPCFAPHEEGEGCGRSCFSLHQPSCTKPLCPSLFASKTRWVDKLRGAEGREDVPTCVQGPTASWSASAERQRGDGQSPLRKEGVPPPGWERLRERVLLMLRGNTGGHESWGTVGNWQPQWKTSVWLILAKQRLGEPLGDKDHGCGE